MADVRISLPIDPYLAEIADKVSNSAFYVLTADPGTGKTTRVPGCLAERLPGKILVLEPRRLAARVSAERIAQERGEPVGQAVGYITRFERRVSDATRILFITEGLLLRMVRSNPLLEDVSCVILDEFHERSVHTDVALGILRLIHAKRPSLRTVIMSATIDAETLCAQLPGSATLHVPGRTYPLEFEYLGDSAPEQLANVVRDAAMRMVNDTRCSGHILVFLPGTRDIQQCKAAIEQSWLGKEVVVIPLTADAPMDRQRAAFADSEQRKIVLATNVAETSVTIPGVTGVIDGGLAKIAGHASWSGMPTLEVMRISRASCDQRAGRAGRTGPGVVYRLFSEGSYRQREAQLVPEIARVDLSSAVLGLSELLGAGVYGQISANSFPWLESPPAEQLTAALQLLQRLGAMTDHGELTERGGELAPLPMHPRSAAIYVQARALQKPALGLLVALIAEAGDVFEGATPRSGTYHSDVEAAVHAFQQSHRSVGRGGRPRGLERMAREMQSLKSRLCPHDMSDAQVPDPNEMQRWLLAGYPDRVAKRQQRQGNAHGQPLYHFCLGRGGRLSPSSLARDADYIVALDVTENLRGFSGANSAMIRVASAIDVEILRDERSVFCLCQEVTRFDDRLGKALKFRQHSYGELVLSEERIDGGQTQDDGSLVDAVLEKWPYPFADNLPLQRYHAKLKLLDRAKIEHNLPQFADDFLQLLIESICDGKTSTAEILQRPLVAYIHDMLTYDQQQLLSQHAPDSLRLSNGIEVAVNYDDDGQPRITLPIQDAFGQSRAPMLAMGRIAPIWSLLAPNKRPVQTTADLDNFWKSTYPTLVGALSRRYPKHHWPVDPRTAPAVRLKSRL